MKKIFCLLVLAIMLLGLCACGDKQTGEEDFQFMQGERIRQADLDFCWNELVYAIGGSVERTDEAEMICLSTLAMMRTMIWEAEAQGVGLSWDDALAEARAQYEEAEAASKAGQRTGDEIYQMPEYWDWLQEHMQQVGMNPENWLCYNAILLQSDAATEALQEQFYADLTPEQLNDDLARKNAQIAYHYELVDKYKDRLVEEDLEPLLDEVLETLRQGSR